MADQLSGIAIIICIAFGVLTFVLLFIFANRQIKRFSLKSKSGPHAPLAQDAPKALQTEINRRLDIVKAVSYQPKLLKREEESLLCNETNDCHIPTHLYRMKALDSIVILDASIVSVDPSKVRQYNQDYRVYLIRLFQSGLLGQIEIATVHRFVDLYEFARHEPGNFGYENYLQFTELMNQIHESILSRSSNSQQNNKNHMASLTVAEPMRFITNGKVPAVPSCLQIQPPSEDKKATYETSV